MANPLVALSVCEIRHLLWSLLWKVAPVADFILAWSRWRRQHQFRANAAHYSRRLAILPP